MIATIPSEATRGARAVRDGPKYGGRRGGAPGGTEEVGCDASPIAAPVPGRYHTGDGDITPTQSVSAAPTAKTQIAHYKTTVLILHTAT